MNRNMLDHPQRQKVLEAINQTRVLIPVWVRDAIKSVLSIETEATDERVYHPF